MDRPTQIKGLLLKKGITQTHLMSKTGWNYTVQNQFINGHLILKERDQKRFCRILKIDFDEFQKGNVKELQ